MNKPFGPWSDNSGPFLWFWIVLFSLGLAGLIIGLVIAT